MNRILVFPADEAKLRRKAKKVTNPQGTQEILCVQAMKRHALEFEQTHPGELCVGLAATQIGVPLRIIIMRNMEMPRAPQDPFVLNREQVIKLYGDIDEDLDARHRYFLAIYEREAWLKTEGVGYDPYRVMYNPVYVKSEGMQDSEEGCLSVPQAHGETMRPAESTFYYYDHNLKRVPERGPKGEDTFLVAQGFTSCVLCHELDHLNGTLFVDSALKVWRPGTKPKGDEPDLSCGGEYGQHVADMSEAAA